MDERIKIIWNFADFITKNEQSEAVRLDVQYNDNDYYIGNLTLSNGNHYQIYSNGVVI